MKTNRKPDFDIDGFAPGSIIWIRCQEAIDIGEMTKAIEELALEQFVFIVTGPDAKIETLSPSLLKQALRLSAQTKGVVLH